MEIENQDGWQKVELRTIAIGDCFKWNAGLYIKTNECDNDGWPRVVHLGTGILDGFEDAYLVYPQPTAKVVN